ncbi:MAG: hypothetical protein Q9159_007227 [Coniocarpon cinnabarinum]
MTAMEDQKSVIVNFAKSGAYPVDHNGALSASLQATSVSSARQSLQQARQELEISIRATSRQVAPDVDGWIERAKQLQADIEQSRDIAREIVNESERAKTAQEKVMDASRRAELLRTETHFHGGLSEMLGKIRSARDKLNEARKSVSQGATSEALQQMQQLERDLPRIGDTTSTNALDLLHQRIQDLRGDILEQTRSLMRKTIDVDSAKRCLVVRRQVQSEAGSLINLEEVINLSARIGLLQEDLSRIASNIETFIVTPILVNATFAAEASCVRCFGEVLELSQSSTEALKNANVIEDLIKTIKFLKDKLPNAANEPLSKMLIPSIIAYLVANKIPAALPVDVQASSELVKITDQIQSLADALDEVSWGGSEDLLECNQNIPKMWLAKRREEAIDTVRLLASKRLNTRKNVEHVETQVVSSDDAMVQAATVPTDDWNEDWGEADDAEEEKKSSETPARSEKDQKAAEEDDWGGWDAEEQESRPHANGLTNAKPSDDTNDGDVWDEWDEQKSDHAPATSDGRDKAHAPKVNGHHPPVRSKATQREVTLRETYTVTALPDELYAQISALLADAKTLHSSSYSSSPLASTAPALYSIPTISIAAFRSLAPPAYELLQGGNMLLFNDCNRLASNLKSLRSELQASNDVGASRLKLDQDIAALEGFARRNYGKAMDEQRTISRDLIDNAQGFANCTSHPYKSACEDAVNMTIAHLRSIAELWKTILSRNVWLQALGSLLSTVIGKITIDIEEMSDIGAEESIQLKTYVTEVSQLKELFVQDGQDTVGLYVREWFKFQYLAEVLDSNLEDIKYLWREGGLRDEFEVDEVVDLVEALFADGDRRRRAITDIRRG